MRGSLFSRRGVFVAFLVASVVSGPTLALAVSHTAEPEAPAVEPAPGAATVAVDESPAPVETVEVVEVVEGDEAGVWEPTILCAAGGTGGSGGDGGESEDGSARGGGGGDGGTGVRPGCDQNANQGAVPLLECDAGGYGGGGGDGGSADGASARGGGGGDGGTGTTPTCEQNANGPVAPTMNCDAGAGGGSGGDGGETAGGDDGVAFEVSPDGTFALETDDLVINASPETAEAGGGDPGTARGGEGGDGGRGTSPTCSQNTSAL